MFPPTKRKCLRKIHLSLISPLSHGRLSRRGVHVYSPRLHSCCSPLFLSPRKNLFSAMQYMVFINHICAKTAAKKSTMCVQLYLRPLQDCVQSSQQRTHLSYAGHSDRKVPMQINCGYVGVSSGTEEHCSRVLQRNTNRVLTPHKHCCYK